MNATTDRDFLLWIHALLTEVHHESQFVDYMHKLRAIITTIPPEQNTPSDGRGGNTLEQLIEILKAKDATGNDKVTDG